MASRRPYSDNLLANHEVVRTDRLDQMSEVLLNVYKGRLVAASGGGRRFFGQANRVQFKHVGFDYCAYDADVEIDFPGASPFRQQICLNGGGETIMRGFTAPVSIDTTCVIRPDEKVTVRFGGLYRQLVFRADPDELRRKLEALAGTHLSRPLEFRPTQKLLSPQAQMLKRSALFLAGAADTFAGEACRLAREEFEQALLTAFLTGNAHNYSYLLEAPPPDLTPRHVWLAEAFIEAHWDEPLSVEALADVVGVGARSVFKAFKDHRGYSPMTFVKDVRLRQARKMLREATPGATVTAVAYRCGYQNHGYFARQYRARFGESPSATLAHGRRGVPT